MRMPSLSKFPALAFPFWLVVGMGLGFVFGNWNLDSVSSNQQQSIQFSIPETSFHVQQEAQIIALSEELRLRFREFQKQPNPSQIAALDEIIAVFMRTDPVECISVLSDLNSAGLGQSFLEQTIDTNDVRQTLYHAGKIGGAVGEQLIREAFLKHIVEDPEDAALLLEYLPAHLRDSLAVELAKSWPLRNPSEAARKLLLLGKRFVDAKKIAIGAWAKHDPVAAFEFVHNAEAIGYAEKHGMMDSLAKSAAEIKPGQAWEFLESHGQELLDYRAFNGIIDLARTLLNTAGPEMALEKLRSLDNVALRAAAARGMAGMSPNKYFFEFMAEMPNTDASLKRIAGVAERLAKADADPFALLSGQPDIYQHQAAVQGAAQGVIQSKGVDGIAAVLRKAVVSQDMDWLKATAEIVSSGSSGADRQDWKRLPPDLIVALLNYAESNLPRSKVDVLKSRFRK